MNKGDKSFILPLQRLCSGCHYKAVIDNNINTQRRNGSHSRLCNTQRNYSEVVDECVCVCVLTVFPDKNKSDRISKRAALIF